jgi:tyrosinase
MSETYDGLTRRHFLQTTMVAAGAAAFPFHSVFAQSATAKYRRYNVTSAQGKKALASYAKGVEAMLNLPASDPRNWFRNAFVHLMDCPHGNWWFYVWHRGYVGFFEETIRNLSGDPTFAMPYWDWTALPQIPDGMFDGVLNPQHHAFEMYTRNLDDFTAFIQPALKSYWRTLSADQRAQLDLRGYTSLDLLWNEVTGLDPKTGNGNSANMAFANTCGSRYLTRDNPKLDKRTTFDVSIQTILAGLEPKKYYDPDITQSFTSSKTTSHNAQPGGPGTSSVLESYPHNKTHNYIGGVGPLDPGPYGNMTNNLSPVDPIFFLHHSNMDRLWDVWTRKQKRLNLPILPPEPDLGTLSKEPFLFFVNGNGKFVGNSRAGEYLSTERFQYDYEPGSGDEAESSASLLLTKKHAKVSVKGEMKGRTALMSVPRAAVNEHLAAAAPMLIAAVTVQRPSDKSSAREFDVLIGAPADVTSAGPDSPYYAGTIAFFGHMTHPMAMSEDVTFAVPLPKRREMFHNLAAAQVSVNIRLVPVQAHGKAAGLKSVSVRSVQ